MKHDLFQQQIDRYLDQRMEAHEAAQFRQVLATDKQASDEVMLQQDVRQGIEAAAALQMKSLLQQADTGNRLPAGSTGIQRPSFFRMSIAASLLILLVCSYLRWFMPLRAEALAADYHQPYPNILVLNERSAQAGNAPQAWQQGLLAYEQGDFENALRLLGEHPEPTPVGIQFYMAMSNFELKHNQEAIDQLSLITRVAGSSFHLPARWYLALACIREKQTEAAMQQLQILSAFPNSYQLKARTLMDALKRGLR